MYLDGELDIASAESAVSYVRDVIDHRRGPVIVNLAALAFCDARGLAALVRRARYAEQSDCPFQVTSSSPRLVQPPIRPSEAGCPIGPGCAMRPDGTGPGIGQPPKRRLRAA